MVRRGVDRPGIGDWSVLAAAIVVSLVLLLSAPGFKYSAARALSGSIFLPFRLVLSYGRCPLDTAGEISALRQQLARRSIDRAMLADALAENARLRTLLDFSVRSEHQLIPAQVVGRAADRFGEMLTLAPGRASGTAVGQPVVAVHGLVGCVIARDGNRCRARTLRHGGLPVTGMLASSRYVGVLRWEPRQRLLRLEGIPLQHEVAVGESVVTSGYGGLFPKGIPVGAVLAVGDDSTGLVKEILVAPAVDLDRTEEVFLLRE